MLGLLEKFFPKVSQEVVIEIFAAQMCVSCGSFDCEDATSDVQKGHVESSTAQIENEDMLFLLALGVETIGDCGSCRFIDDTQNVKTGNSTGILGGETLGVIKIRRYSVNTER